MYIYIHAYIHIYIYVKIDIYTHISVNPRFPLQVHGLHPTPPFPDPHQTRPRRFSGDSS